MARQWRSELTQDRGEDELTLPSDRIGRAEWLMRQVLPACGNAVVAAILSDHAESDFVCKSSFFNGQASLSVMASTRASTRRS